MNTAAAASEIVQRLSLPVQPTDSVKARMNRAARYAGLPVSRVKKLWYGEVRDPKSSEWERLKQAERRWMKERVARLDAETAALKARLEAMGAADPE